MWTYCKLSAAHFLETVDRKSTRLNSSHGYISYAVFCLKKKNTDVEGGGTGKGGAPFVVRLARELKAVAVGVVPQTCVFDGRNRSRRFELGNETVQGVVG